MNLSLLNGNITKDAVINSVSDKQDAVNFTVATNRSYKDKEGNWQDLSQFHNCTRFIPKGKGEKLAAQLTKGRGIKIKGNLKTTAPRPGGQDGKSYVNNYIRVNDIAFGAKPVEKAAEQA